MEMSMRRCDKAAMVNSCEENEEVYCSPEIFAFDEEGAEKFITLV